MLHTPLCYNKNKYERKEMGTHGMAGGTLLWPSLPAPLMSHHKSPHIPAGSCGGCCHHRPSLLVPLSMSSDSSPIHTSLPPYEQLLIAESGAMASSPPHSCHHPVLPPSHHPFSLSSPPCEQLLAVVVRGPVVVVGPGCHGPTLCHWR